MSFNNGDQVCWSSQAAGRHLNKLGRVIAIVPAGVSPRSSRAEKYSCNVDDLLDKFNATSAYGGGFTRDHQSYLVLVSFPGTKRKPKLYWPRVSALRAATALDVA